MFSWDDILFPWRKTLNNVQVEQSPFFVNHCETKNLITYAIFYFIFSIFDIKTAEEKYRMNFAGRLQDALIQVNENIIKM